MYVSWIHPSYRDLVIEELTNDSSLGTSFLTHMTLEGIKLALSDATDYGRGHSFLLVTSEESWDILESRCRAIAEAEPKRTAIDLIEVLTSTATQSGIETGKQQILSILSQVCQLARERWDTLGVALSAADFRTYARASVLLTPLPPMPDVSASWKSAMETFERTLNEYESGQPVEAEELRKWFDLIDVVADTEPRFLKQASFPQRFTGDLSRLIRVIEDEIKDDTWLDSYDELMEEADRLSSVAEVLFEIQPLYPSDAKRLEELSEALWNRADDLRGEADSLPVLIDEDEDLHGWDLPTPNRFDIDALFADL